MADKESGRIVVGVDGSPSSIDALRWAVRQAEATGSEIRAVAAWDVTMAFGYPPSYDQVDWSADARKTVDAVVGDVMAAESPVTATTQVVRGHAGTVLTDESRDADLLVVGSRGHGTAVGMLLGSVSQYCVEHATCQVVGVRAHRN